MKNMLREVLKELGNTKDEVLSLIHDFLRKINADDTGNFLREFKKFLRKEECWVIKLVTFTVSVDETQSVEELVKAGNFNWSNGSINSQNFPNQEKYQKMEKEITLFHFNEVMSSDAVIAEMDRVGYKPATVWDILGLAIKEPDLQRSFPIVALGSVCEFHNTRRMACLCYDSGGRGLGLLWFNSETDDRHRFAGVRKP